MERVQITPSSVSFFLLMMILFIVAYFVRYLILITLVGIGIGALISPLLNKMRSKLNFPRGLSAVILFFLLFLLLGGVAMSMVYLISDQLATLSERAPVISGRIQSWVANFFRQYPWIKDQVQSFDLAEAVKSIMTQIFKSFGAGFVAISGFLFALIIGLYTSISAGEYFEDLVEVFPRRYQLKASEVLLKMASVLRGWFKAQLIDMLIIGFLTALGLWVAQVEYWAVFGLLTAVLGIIPYLGIILVIITATLITLGSDPGQVPWVLLVFLITQQLEGNLILPMVMKGSAELPVVPLLVFMLLLGSFFGILGAFIAPPLFAVLRVLYIEIYLQVIRDKREKSESTPS